MVKGVMKTGLGFYNLYAIKRSFVSAVAHEFKINISVNLYFCTSTHVDCARVAWSTILYPDDYQFALELFSVLLTLITGSRR